MICIVWVISVVGKWDVDVFILFKIVSIENSINIDKSFKEIVF